MSSISNDPVIHLPVNEISTKKLVEISQDGKLILNFHEGQAQTWNSRARFILMLSGSQGGKTSFGPWWLWNEIQARGSGDYIAATTNFDLFKLKMLPEMRYCFEEVLGIGRYWAGDRVMELMDPLTGRFLAQTAYDRMWARIILRSAEAPGGLESLTAKGAWLDEVGQDEWDITIFEAILRRLALSMGRVLGTTTVYNTGWTKTAWYDRAVSGDRDYAIVQFDSIANPVFPQSEFERAKRTMPQWRFDMFYRGRYSKPVGLIYSDFDDSMLFDLGEVDLPSGWTHFVSVDFGGANTAVLYICEDALHLTPQNQSVFYIYMETLEGGLATDEHVARVKDRTKGVTKVIGVGGAKSETQFRRDWKKAGQSLLEPKVHEVEIGISAVTELLKTGRLRVAKSCLGLRDELVTYRRKIDPERGVTEEIEGKKHFHRLDALRYFAVQVVNPARHRAGSARPSKSQNKIRR